MSTSVANSKSKTINAEDMPDLGTIMRELARDDFLRRQKTEQTKKADEILVPGGDALAQLLKELSDQVKVIRTSERVDHRGEAVRASIDLAGELEETLDRINIQLTEATRPEI